jgi:NADH dehydrogenase/NADH:ubiquinone oxidoreductase subunit G
MEVIMENITDNVITDPVETPTETPKTYTQEEVLALLQSEGDKRVNQALAKQKKEYEKKLSLSKLDGDEREKAERENRITELEQMIADMNIERNKSELKSVLSSRGLSAEFCDILQITDDIEASQANIDKLDKLFKAAVRAEVEKRLAGSAPKGNGGALSTELSKEEAKKMNMAQRQNLFNTNPELYKKLFD